jgi:glycosyltransferase involved in cell wall biosynthesis
MTVTFFTNFINHHQVAVADEFFKILGNDYAFVATESMPQSFKDNGYPDFSDRIYLLNSYENYDLKLKALELGLSSDIVIIGSASDEFINERLKNNKITFRYNERWFKKGDYQLFSPRGWVHWFNNHIKYRNKPLFMLCASSYTANDVAKVFAYPNKCYKWGYFPKVEDLDIENILKIKKDKIIKLFWVARWIDLKHPEMVIQLALKLKNKEYDFHIEMAGEGILINKMKLLAKSLNVIDKITFLGILANDKVMDKMKESHVFLFTSDRNEGWGAVLNEAMSNGCTVVASHAIGSVPFLVKHNENGLIFKSESIDALVSQVEVLIKDRVLCDRLARNAYQSMLEVWSPKNAAINFINLASSLMLGKEKLIAEGPCSKADPVNKKSLLNILR